MVNLETRFSNYSYNYSTHTLCFVFLFSQLYTLNKENMMIALRSVIKQSTLADNMLLVTKRLPSKFM